MADTDTMFNFLLANDDILSSDTPLTSLTQYKDFETTNNAAKGYTVQLSNRRRIMVKPTADCDLFRFNMPMDSSTNPATETGPQYFDILLKDLDEVYWWLA